MLITHDTNEVTLSNVGTTGEFKIRNSARAFSILSSGLYSNKIKAIVRELSTNALDSHVGAGKADVPFEVHLPTMLEPWFAVRDFGMGLNGTHVIDIYSTYFESTKTHSNDFVGALGLGSKSPFSYTENFTVTAIKDGTQRIYSAFINEMGVPSIVEMNEELTDEGNGVEVKFSVTDQNDYRSFQNEAREVFKWFTNKPVITGNVLEHTIMQYSEENIIPGVHLMQNTTRYRTNESIAVMGSIAYPLSDIPEPRKHFGDLARLLDCGLVFSFNIGELDFVASREHLSYIPLTISSIRAKLTELNDNLAAHLVTKVDEISSDWDKAVYLYDQANSDLYRSAVLKFVADTKFPLYNTSHSYGHMAFTHETAALLKRKLSIKVFRYDVSSYKGGQCCQIKTSSKHINNIYTEVCSVPVKKDLVIVLNDLKTGCIARAQYHYSNHIDRKQVTVICLTHEDSDLEVRQLEYDKFLKELHNPPTVVKASTLEMRERSKATPSTGIASIRLKRQAHKGYAESYTWEPATGIFDTTETYYYIGLENFTPIDKAGNYIDFFHIKSLIDSCGIKEIKDIEVYGVRKSRIKEIQGLSNWVYYEDTLKQEIGKITDIHIASLVASDMLDGCSRRVYTNESVAKDVGTNSEYAKYVDFVTSIKRTTGNVKQLVELCEKFDNKLRIDDTKKKIQDAKDKVNTTYPLLRFFKDESSVHEEAKNYIKLIDNQVASNI